jgi:hypothetical protein
MSMDMSRCSSMERSMSHSMSHSMSICMSHRVSHRLVSCRVDHRVSRRASRRESYRVSRRLVSCKVDHRVSRRASRRESYRVSHSVSCKVGHKVLTHGQTWAAMVHPALVSALSKLSRGLTGALTSTPPVHLWQVSAVLSGHQMGGGQAGSANTGDTGAHEGGTGALLSGRDHEGAAHTAGLVLGPRAVRFVQSSTGGTLFKEGAQTAHEEAKSQAPHKEALLTTLADKEASPSIASSERHHCTTAWTES